MTVLFADLVGSTALGETLDPEEVKLVVGEAIARIVREVEDFGGAVKDLAGDGVLAFFGAPVASRGRRRARRARRPADRRGDARSTRPRSRAGVGRRGLRRPRRRRHRAGRARRDRRRLARRVRRVRRHGQPGRAAPVGGRAGHGARRRGDARARSRALFDMGRAAVARAEGQERAGHAPGPSRARATAARGGAGSRAPTEPLVGRDRELGAGADEWLDAAPRRRGRGALPHGRGRHRQEPAHGRARPPLRGAPGRGRGAAPGWRAAASRTASRCRTGRSATCCANGSASRPTSRSCACASSCAAALERALRRRAPARSTRTSARLLGITLEPDAAARAGRALARGAPVPHIRGRRRAARPARRGRTGRVRDRGPALGRPDVACSSSSGCSPLTEQAAVLLLIAQRAGARPPVLGAEGAGGA